MEHPFTCIVSGPTKAGKTLFVSRLINENIIKPKLHNIWWCYTEDHPQIKGIRFIRGIPDIEQMKGKVQLLILDDMMQEMKNNPQLTQVFTRGCHHWEISVIHIVQNAFFEGLRTSRINTDYLVLFKNPADQLQSQTLARFLFPTNPKYFLEAYADATRPPHGYLFIDLTQKTPDELRLKTNIFEKNPTFYIPKSINMEKLMPNKTKNGSRKVETKSSIPTNTSKCKKTATRCYYK